MMKHRGHMAWAMAAGLLICGWAGIARAQEETEPERARRAAFALKFIQYTRWPDSSFENEASPVVVTVLGDSVARHLRRLVADDVRAQDRRIAVRRLVPPAANAPDDQWREFRQRLAGTHALYIDAAYAPHVPRILEATRGTDILTISNTRSFAERGGMLGLTFQNSKYEIRANLEVIKKSRLAVSAKVLELAKIVSGGSGSGPTALPAHVHAGAHPLQSLARS